VSDFIWNPDNIITAVEEFKTLVSTFENGVEQRRKKRTRQDKSWRLTFKNRTQAEKNQILAFFQSKYGQYSSFTWTNPEDSTEYTVRFNSDKLSVTRNAYNIYSIEIEFKEVL